MRRKFEHLPDGEYFATCKERNVMSATMNGHHLVFPQARMTVTAGIARFYRDGKEVWDCNSIYAASHFIIQKA